MTKAALASTESDIIVALKERDMQFQNWVNWFKRQMFGETSEKRFLPEGQAQDGLLALLGKKLPEHLMLETEAITYERKKPGKTEMPSSTIPAFGSTTRSRWRSSIYPFHRRRRRIRRAGARWWTRRRLGAWRSIRGRK